jgi:hypothetical protein
MSANNDPISKALNLSPITLSNDPVKNIMSDALNNSATTDFETARANLIAVIEVIKESIDNLTQISAASQHPRAFEVLAKLTDSYVTANKELLELQNTIRGIDAADTSTSAGSVTNNLFVGSTHQLQQIINQLKK